MDIFVGGVGENRDEHRDTFAARTLQSALRMWGDFFFPVFAYGVSLLLLSFVAAASHRVRAWRSQKSVERGVVVRLEPRVAAPEPRSDRRAA